tara:strand:+ start:383 stop:3085 length:2703 start_codon:yes stop_codon:yes gene_type:complete
MSVQLIVFPQYFDGSTPLSSPSNELVVDGINFNQVNTSTSTQSVSGALPQSFVNTYSIFGLSLFAVNTWYRFSGVASEITQSSGSLAIPINTGIVQRLSNLTYGATYDLTINVNSNTTQFTVYQYKGNQLISSNVITGTGLNTVSFNANSTADVIVIYSVTSVVGIADVSCVLSTSTPSGIFTDLSNGQVICDLYEDEDIPLSLSVDDFKNVAEKVQSYSKAFNLPATKRNNQIFDNIFEITRTDTGLNFNPYKRTKAILKQDGFLLFEGYLRMLDISDKSGETSYNVNLYSEVVALADVLGDKTFSELDFTELNHDYQKTNIINSWNDAGTGITYTNASTSGFRNAYSTVKYPFVDWTHQALIGGSTGTGAISGNPEYTDLGQIFRPFINIKYLIDRIFQAVPFTFESDFFNTDDFKKLYMDFNWGTENAPVEINNTQYSSLYWYDNGTGGVANIATTSFTNMILNSTAFLGSINLSETPPNYDSSTHIITSTVVNESYDIGYNYSIENTDSSARTVECQWLYNSTPINNSGIITIAAGGTFTYTGNLTQVMTTVGDTLQVQFKASVGSVVRQEQQTSYWTADVIFQVGVTAVTNNTILQNLRGETGQWDFLKGIMTMFNLVTLPDEDNPSNIKIEPYSDVFLNNPNSVELDWTEKIDVSEMKLIPLTDLNKKTIFKFVEDEDDFAFMNYKRQVGGHLYGSKKYNAGNEFNILSGEDEIIAEPFAATVIKPLDDLYPDLITPAIYSYNSNDDTSEGFENSPRIMFNNGIKPTVDSYFIPAQNGLASQNLTSFLQFSHFSAVSPQSAPSVRDFHFGECQLIQPVGSPVNNNLFNLYWLPYYAELYNPDTRIMTIKVNLSPSDINTFKFNDTVFIKNRTFRVNKIDYKPNDLATVEFILIP